jgi:hypothetical protein
LRLDPAKGSYHLRLAELNLLQGRYAEADKLISQLKNAKLSRSEQQAMSTFVACLASGEPAARCIK